MTPGHIAREMTLDEWVASLPGSHRAKKELATLEVYITALEERERKLVEVLQSYPGRSVSEQEHNDWIVKRESILAPYQQPTATPAAPPAEKCPYSCSIAGCKGECQDDLDVD